MQGNCKVYFEYIFGVHSPSSRQSKAKLNNSQVPNSIFEIYCLWTSYCKPYLSNQTTRYQGGHIRCFDGTTTELRPCACYSLFDTLLTWRLAVPNLFANCDLITPTGRFVLHRLGKRGIQFLIVIDSGVSCQCSVAGKVL